MRSGDTIVWTDGDDEGRLPTVFPRVSGSPMDRVESRHLLAWPIAKEIRSHHAIFPSSI